MIFWVLLAAAAGLMLGYLAMLLFRPTRLKYVVTCEYWVYLPEEQPPSQDAVMSRMIRDNPYKVDGQIAIGPREGIMFSDIRLHSALVLRSKNPHVFRPDLFAEHVEPTARDLEALAEAKALQKIRFVSEEPLRDDRYLQFLPHMALAVADIAGSQIIFDTVAEKLITVQRMRDELAENGDATRPELQMRIIWQATGGEGSAETRGLLKMGLPEIVTEPANADQRVLLTTVLEEAARQIWEAKSIPLKLAVEAYQDVFELQLTPAHKGPYKARIFRAQTI